jgi:hypothetical protein
VRRRGRQAPTNPRRPPPLLPPPVRVRAGIFMFKAAGRYYLGWGQCCCFCAAGSNVELLSAPSPLGPYTSQGSIIAPQQWGAQTGAVWWTGAQWVLYGDRWQSAPDHIKAHDFSYWAALTLNATSGVFDPLPGWQDNVTIAY